MTSKPVTKNESFALNIPPYIYTSFRVNKESEYSIDR